MYHLNFFDLLHNHQYPDLSLHSRLALRRSPVQWIVWICRGVWDQDHLVGIDLAQSHGSQRLDTCDVPVGRCQCWCHVVRQFGVMNYRQRHSNLQSTSNIARSLRRWRIANLASLDRYGYASLFLYCPKEEVLYLHLPQTKRPGSEGRRSVGRRGSGEERRRTPDKGARKR